MVSLYMISTMPLGTSLGFLPSRSLGIPNKDFETDKSIEKIIFHESYVICH
jgi:hypothetical protein